MKRAVGATLLGVAFMASALNVTACAHEGFDESGFQPLSDANIRHFDYDFNSDPGSYLMYDTIRNVMNPVFAGTYADKTKEFQNNPLIASVEVDLNGDTVNEIVARPVDTEDDGDVFCGPDLLCPNYIIDTKGKEPRVLGVIKAMKVDRGDDIKNGYWTLKAFTHQKDPEKFSTYDTYTYDKKTRQYALDKSVPPRTLDKK